MEIWRACNGAWEKEPHELELPLRVGTNLLAVLLAHAAMKDHHFVVFTEQEEWLLRQQAKPFLPMSEYTSRNMLVAITSSLRELELNAPHIRYIFAESPEATEGIPTVLAAEFNRPQAVFYCGQHEATGASA